jgi:hypothetical protein
MKKYISLVLAAIIFLNVIVSFFRDNEVENVFGIEMNIWVFRFLWTSLGLLLVQGFIKEKNKEKDTTEK